MFKTTVFFPMQNPLGCFSTVKFPRCHCRNSTLNQASRECNPETRSTPNKLDWTSKPFPLCSQLRPRGPNLVACVHSRCRWRYRRDGRTARVTPSGTRGEMKRRRYRKNRRYETRPAVTEVKDGDSEWETASPRHLGRPDAWSSLRDFLNDRRQWQPQDPVIQGRMRQLSHV